MGKCVGERERVWREARASGGGTKPLRAFTCTYGGRDGGRDGGRLKQSTEEGAWTQAPNK
jgi:hypothetical protein